jgi:hypothetical protein
VVYPTPNDAARRQRAWRDVRWAQASEDSLSGPDPDPADDWAAEYEETVGLRAPSRGPEFDPVTGELVGPAPRPLPPIELSPQNKAVHDQR